MWIKILERYFLEYQKFLIPFMYLKKYWDEFNELISCSNTDAELTSLIWNSNFWKKHSIQISLCVFQIASFCFKNIENKIPVKKKNKIMAILSILYKIAYSKLNSKWMRCMPMISKVINKLIDWINIEISCTDIPLYNFPSQINSKKI